MSKIQITELQESKSELNLLDDCQTGNVVGGYGDFKLNLGNLVQVNNNITVQVALGGSNYNWTSQTNKGELEQG
jgi:hypothetical protein